MAKSLLYQGVTPFTEPPECGVLVCRFEVPVTIRKDNRLYRFILRDKVLPEDPYLVMIRAVGFAITTGEFYKGLPPSRSVRDWLIKNSVVI
jgi:hypothetical protein